MKEIQNEADAWELVSNFVATGTVERVVFSGWPRMAISVKGPGYESSISAAQMDALLGFQTAVNRAYAAIAKGHFDARYLTDDEASDLELRTKVKKGSSIFETDLSPLIQALSVAVKSANSDLLVVAAVLVCLGITAPAILKRIYDGRAEELRLKNEGALISAVTNRNTDERNQERLFDKALGRVSKKYPALAAITLHLNKAQVQLIDSMHDADSATISGVTLGRDQIETLSKRRPRRKHYQQILKGDFEISAMTKRQKGYRLTLVEIDTDVAIIADLDTTSIAEIKVTRLLRAFRESSPVWFAINIRRSDQSIIKGAVEDFQVRNNAP